MRSKWAIAAMVGVSIVCALPFAGIARAQTASNDPSVLSREASDLFNSGRVQEALPIIRKILSIKPDDPTALLYLQIYNLQIKEPMCRQAAAAYFEGQYKEASSLWQEILRKDPLDTRAMEMIAKSMALMDADSIDGLIASASRYMDAGMYLRAESELQKVLRIDPGHKKAKATLDDIQKSIHDRRLLELYEHASILFKEEQYDLAIAEWEEILKDHPEQTLAKRLIENTRRKKLDDLYMKAEKLYRDGDYIGARDAMSRILDDIPESQAARRVLDRLNSALGVTKSMRAKGKAWDLARKSLANYISDDGSAEVAVASIWYATQLMPEAPELQATREFIEKRNANTARSMQQPLRDMDVLEQHLYASLDHIYRGRYDLAVRECRLVLELETDNLLALKRLGSAYYLMGSKEKAREVWRRAIGIAPEDEELKEFISLVM